MAAEQKREDIADERRRWKQALADVHPSRLVFLDESGAKTNMTRLYGRAPRGQRVIEYAPGGHWCTTTMLGALRWDRFEAPLVLDGAMDSVVFRGYVQRMLVPTLHPGDVVVMDNLSPHKTLGVQEAIEAAGATVRYLPPYSPDFNPIESMWSKVKQHLRGAAARTHRQLVTAVGDAMHSVTSDDCHGFFTGCGYAGTH